MNEIYRVGESEPRFIFRGEEGIGMMISKEAAALVVRALNALPDDVTELPTLVDGDGARYTRTGSDEYRIATIDGTARYTRAEIDSYGPGETREVWS